MNISEKIAAKRRQLGMSQTALAEAVGVSPQAVSNWETGKNMPDPGIYGAIAKALQITVGELVDDRQEVDTDLELSSRLHSAGHMYTFLKTRFMDKGLMQSLRVLPLARDYHRGQMRRVAGAEVEYISHPLTLACHALALGIIDDNVISTALLHDVAEDCVDRQTGNRVRVEDLPVNEKTKKALALLTRERREGETKEQELDRYYAAMRGDPTACFVKALDRCNNVSTMAMGFSREKLKEYVLETEKYVLPLLDYIKNTMPQYNDAAYLVKYHMRSVLETVKRLL